MINHIVIKIYYLKQLNYNTDIHIKAGTFIYIYLTVSGVRNENASCEHTMLKNGASVEISR